MDDLRAAAADRYLTWQDGRGARRPSRRKLGVSPLIAAVGALALAAGLAIAQEPIASPLTVGTAPRHSLSDAQTIELARFAGTPSLARVSGVRVAPAYGPQDEDCIRADAELICRR